MTNAIFSRIANASPRPGEEQRLVAGDRRGEQRDGLIADDEPERPAQRDREQRLEQAPAELAEVVDERHDPRVVGGHGRTGTGGGRLARRAPGGADVTQCVGVSHGLPGRAT